MLCSLGPSPWSSGVLQPHASPFRRHFGTKTVFRASAEAHNPVFGLKQLLPDPIPTTQRRLSMLSPLRSVGRVLAGQ